MNITSRFDPISLRDMDAMSGGIPLSQCVGDFCLHLTFESEANRQTYLKMPLIRASEGPNLDNPSLEWIDEG